MRTTSRGTGSAREAKPRQRGVKLRERLMDEPTIHGRDSYEERYAKVLELSESTTIHGGRKTCELRASTKVYEGQYEVQLSMSTTIEWGMKGLRTEWEHEDALFRKVLKVSAGMKMHGGWSAAGWQKSQQRCGTDQRGGRAGIWAWRRRPGGVCKIGAIGSH